MITFKKLEKKGRLGNQLFQIAATLGFADKFKQECVFPNWTYNGYFNQKLQIGDVECGIDVLETSFHFCDYQMLNDSALNENINFEGYFQSEKYFVNIKNKILKLFKFDADFVSQIKRKYYNALNKKTIAIHIRRGDYVDNPNYECLPINYYLTALFENFTNWQSYNIVIFSDDIPYCKVHFDCSENVFFADGNEIECLCLGSLCDNFIISNSTYSWWMAWLAEKKGTKIIRPKSYFAGELKNNCDTKDLYPERWIIHDHKPNNILKLIDLKDVTFTIPVSYDHPDRKQNLSLNICFLQSHFSTNIIVSEQGGSFFQYMEKYCTYFNFKTMVWFHRTKMLNEMAKLSTTPIIANWDADVIIPPLQLWLTVDAIRKGADVCYPYKWAFARIPRKPYFKQIEKDIDIGVIRDTKFNGMNNNDNTSVGGAVFFNKESFFKGGGENENFVSFGPEDAERFYRFTKLDFIIKRTLGAIYHINHWVGPNSSNKHPHVQKNRNEWAKIILMSKTELLNYIKKW